MKSIPFITLFLLFHSAVFSQVFRIDSIPQEGILLNKGWKFHAGDNPDFAKIDFDDSKWENIDPTKDVMELPQISKKGEIMWFRLELEIDTSLENEIISLMVNQTGASEIYVNGQLISTFGKISTNPNEIQAYNPSGSPITINLNEIIHTRFLQQRKQVISVKFVLQPNPLYLKIWERPNPVLNIHINKADEIIHSPIFKEAYFSFADYFRGGIFFILGILHIVLFRLNRMQKTNLYAGYYYLFGTLFFLLHINNYQNIHIGSVKMYVHIIIHYLAFAMSMSTVLMVYSITQYRIGIIFWLLFSFPIVFLPLSLLNYKLLSILSVLFPIIMNLEVIKISIFAVIKKKRDSWLVLTGVTGFTVFYTLGLLMTYLGYNTNIISIAFKSFCYTISLFSFPICLTIILAREFTQTSHSLALKLVEVETLSHEKQETLQKQNAELQAALLQGQTLERKRVAADLHDNLGSTMSSLIWTMDAIDVKKLDSNEQNVYQNLKSMLSKAYDEVRMLSHNLLPEEFEKQGLTAALQYFVRKVNQNSSIKFDLQISDNFGRINNKIEFELYSICLELVNNIIKHSKATEAQILLSRTEKQVLLMVSDNGIGTFNNESDGKGMKNVKSRIESLNGTWEITQDNGLINEIRIPI